MPYDPEDFFNIFLENWDEDDERGSMKEIRMVTHLSQATVRRLCEEMGLMPLRNYKSSKREFGEPEPLSPLVQWSLCPRCMRKLNIERIPFTKCWQVHCYTCGYIGSLPEGYCYEEEQ